MEKQQVNNILYGYVYNKKPGDCQDFRVDFRNFDNKSYEFQVRIANEEVQLSCALMGLCNFVSHVCVRTWSDDQCRAIGCSLAMIEKNCPERMGSFIELLKTLHPEKLTADLIHTLLSENYITKEQVIDVIGAVIYADSKETKSLLNR